MTNDMNPCELCLVSPICRKGCEIFERYLYKKLNDPDGRLDATYFLLADRVRKELVSIKAAINKNSTSSFRCLVQRIKHDNK